MRILFVIQGYPPDVLAGHEIRCWRTAEGLRARGHQVLVLTTFLREKGPSMEEGVWRRLRSKFSEDPKASALKWVGVFRHNRRVFDQCLREFRPDLICQWNSDWCTAAFVHHVVDRSRVPVVGVIGGVRPAVPRDLWLHFCETPARGLLAAAAKRACVGLSALTVPTTPKELRYEYATFNSRFVRHWLRDREGLKVGRAEVVYGGVDTDAFPARQPNAYANPPRFLFAGRFDATKDPLTVLTAAKILQQQGVALNVTLAEAGSFDLGYRQRVLDCLTELGGSVEVRTAVRPEDMPGLLHGHDAFIFTSRWEAWSNALLEAMACGLAPLANLCGGPDEVLEEGTNCLLFPHGDPEALAVQMQRLIAEPELVARLGQASQQLVRERFTLGRYLDGFEALLTEVIASRRQTHHG